MKTLFLVRHAKSVNHLTAAADFNRTLNERGIRDATEMAKKLVKNNIMIDRFVSSPAIRAKLTAEFFVNQYNRKAEEIQFVPGLYHGSPEIFDRVISGFDDQFDHVAVFAHNPGITDYAASLTSTRISHIPTGSVFAVASSIHSWKDFPDAKKDFIFFYTPRDGSF
ncbi:MAG TPA: histidine phosphatase family protein [Puia sp.]|nr:histidine phosphatase family protein [Puia sp.]